VIILIIIIIFINCNWVVTRWQFSFIMFKIPYFEIKFLI